ncbi:magnesium transporter [Spirochaeta dissipatitropha]
MVLSPEVIQIHHDAVRSALENADYIQAAEHAQYLSSVRIAEIAREAPREAVYPLLSSIDKKRAGRVLGKLPGNYSAELLAELSPEIAAELLSQVPPDHAADIIGIMSGELRNSIEVLLPVKFLEMVQALGQHKSGTAGSVMTSQFLSIHQGHTVGSTLDALGAAPPEVERTTYIYVTNTFGQPVGVVSVRDLLRSDVHGSLDKILNPSVVAVKVDDSASDAARLIRNRRFTMLPVLDTEGRITGVITFDKAMDILSQDVADQFSGVSAGNTDESFFTPARKAIRMRLPWMIGNVFLNLGAVAVISGFEETIASIAILAAFLPMITDMGGNVGIQALSVAVRSIALGEVRLRDFTRALRKEAAIGLVNGLALGALFAVVAYALQRSPAIGIIAGAALSINVLVAGVVGGTIPFFIKRLGKDPAMMTGPILTTITDITGVSIYLGLSTIFLL